MNFFDLGWDTPSTDDLLKASWECSLIRDKIKAEVKAEDPLSTPWGLSERARREIDARLEKCREYHAATERYGELLGRVEAEMIAACGGLAEVERHRRMASAADC